MSVASSVFFRLHIFCFVGRKNGANRDTIVGTTSYLSASFMRIVVVSPSLSNYATVAMTFRIRNVIVTDVSLCTKYKPRVSGYLIHVVGMIGCSLVLLESVINLFFSSIMLFINNGFLLFDLCRTNFIE